MSETRKAKTDNLFFITFTVVGWADVFNRSNDTDEVVNNLKYCQQHNGLDLFTCVVMTNHMHLIARRRDGGNLSDFIRDFKSYTAKRLLDLIFANPQESRKEWLKMIFEFHGAGKKQNELYAFWQKTNHPIELWSPEVTQQKVNYIHENPVRAGFVCKPEDWLLSSASPSSPIKVIAL